MIKPWAHLMGNPAARYLEDYCCRKFYCCYWLSKRYLGIIDKTKNTSDLLNEHVLSVLYLLLISSNRLLQNSSTGIIVGQKRT